jgi:hypothetical protein
VSKLCAADKKKKVEFCLREITQGSKKKTYGPYLGHTEKLAKPIQLKGRLVERTPVARLKPKSSAKKGGVFSTGNFDVPIMSMNNINNINKEALIKKYALDYKSSAYGNKAPNNDKFKQQ